MAIDLKTANGRHAIVYLLYMPNPMNTGAISAEVEYRAHLG